MKEKLIIKIVYMLPKVIIYWSTIRLITTVNKNHPNDLSAIQYLKAWKV